MNPLDDAATAAPAVAGTTTVAKSVPLDSQEIAEATGDPEIASQDSAAAGYAPPPPGASTARAAFACVRVAATDTGCHYPQ